MHPRRFNAAIDRLRSPERLALLEVDRVVKISLEGKNILSVLDVGTGSGIFAEAFSQQGIAVTGIDPNPEMLKVAAQFAPDGEYRQATVEEMPFADKSFDLVFLGHVLHESDDLAKALSESKRCAKQRVIILEWPYINEEKGPPFDHRLDPTLVIEEAKKIGFKNVNMLQLTHMILFIFEV
jgi:ubiquinone/menaquinone biosynthesis C-methylase UbiE